MQQSVSNKVNLDLYSHAVRMFKAYRTYLILKCETLRCLGFIGLIMPCSQAYGADWCTRKWKLNLRGWHFSRVELPSGFSVLVNAFLNLKRRHFYDMCRQSTSRSNISFPIWGLSHLFFAAKPIFLLLIVLFLLMINIFVWFDKDKRSRLCNKALDACYQVWHQNSVPIFLCFTTLAIPAP